MFRSFCLVLSSIVLVSGFVFPATGPYVAVYPQLVGIILALFLVGGRQWDVVGLLPFRALWFALVALLVTIPFVFKNEGDLFVFALILPVLLAPAVTMLLREEPALSTPLAIGLLCLAGAAGALGIASYEVFVEGLSRVGHVNNPIHFGALSLILGFLALVGLFGGRSQWRFLFLTGPALSAGATVLAGTSGPLVALALTTIVTVPLLVVWFWRENGFRIAVILVVMVAIAGSFIVSPGLVAKGLDGVRDVISLSTGDDAIGESSKERLVLYSAAYQAFLASPVFGHGSGHLAEATGKYMPSDFASMRHSEHMHNDMADFAVIGGIFGLLAYALILAAPLLVFLTASGRETRRMLLLGGLVLTVGYFTLGLTNAVMGILPQTALFGTALGVLAALAKTETRGAPVTERV